ncbi:MAG TPA: hypothetical protein VN823_24070 [Stellaceae bacterium]|nr:hypothetical protein [Stellaceae bacterium]
MDAPILRYLLPIGPDSPTVGRWTRTHDYDVWTDCRAADAPPLTLWEARENGVLRIPDDETVMHVVKGGTPHHVAQLFGYWRACDSDLVWFRIARADFVRYAIVLGGTPEAYVNDAILWICPSCATSLGRRDFATGPHGIEKFWRGEAESVTAFNSDRAHRTCPSCGHEHPPAYRFRRAGLDEAAPAVAW